MKFTAVVRHADGSKGTYHIDGVIDHEAARAAVLSEIPNARSVMIALNNKASHVEEVQTAA